MASDIRVIHVRDFLQATVHGTLDLESSRAALAEIARAIPPDSELNVMIDVREAPNHLSLVELSDLASEFNRSRMGAGRKTAILTDQARFDNAHFFAVTARGSGHEVQAFTSFEDAFDWLVL